MLGPAPDKALAEMLARARVAAAAAQAPHETIADPRARRDGGPSDAWLLLPGQDRWAGELDGVVAGDPSRQAAPVSAMVELACDPGCRQRRVDHERHARAGDVVDHHQHPEAASVGGHGGDDAAAPALVGRRGQGHRRPRARRSRAPVPIAHRQARRAIKP